MSKGRVAYGPTLMQKKAVDGIINEGKSAYRAMVDAGYSKSVADKPKPRLAERDGVKIYLQTLEQKALKRFKMSLKDKVMETFLNGIDANKYYERTGVEYPDHKTRGEFADRFARFFGWVENAHEEKVSKLQQFNFFAVPPEEQTKFNGRFQKFIKQYYK